MATFEYETTSWPQGRRVFTRIAQDSGHTMLSMVMHTMFIPMAVHTMLNEHCHPNGCARCDVRMCKS